MKKYFFIYSLPRSGSAWLSIFLSQPGSFCFHEPLANKEDLMEQFASRPEEVVGAIDTSAYMNPLVLPASVQTFILWRDWQGIEQSSLRMGFDVDVRIEQRVLTSNLLVTKDNTVRYEDLGNLNYLEILWKEIVGTPFDRERAEYLVEMNIERDIRSVLKRVKKWRNNI